MKRLEFLDYSKAVGIILVVLIHIYAISNQLSRNIIVIWGHSFHMPLFLIISGMLLCHKNVEYSKGVIYSKVKTILIPYINFSIITIIVGLFISGFSLNLLINDCMYTILGGVSILWFLPSLLIGELLLLYLNKVSRIKLLNIILILGMLYLTTLVQSSFIIIQIIVRALVSFSFIGIGYYFYEHICNKSISSNCIIILLIVQVYLSYINGFVDLKNNIFNNNILYILNSLLGSYLIIQVCKRIKECNILRYYGRNTLVIMGLHMNLINIVILFIDKKNFGYLVASIVFIFIMLMQIPLIRLYNHLSRRLWRGRKKLKVSEVCRKACRRPF